jgi:hypothetical protein
MNRYIERWNMYIIIVGRLRRRSEGGDWESKQLSISDPQTSQELIGNECGDSGRTQPRICCCFHQPLIHSVRKRVRERER